MFRFVAEKNLPSGFPVIKQNPGMKVVEKGHTARLLCEADGDPTVNIYWVKDAMRLMPNLRFNVARTGKLRGELRRRNLTSFCGFLQASRGEKIRFYACKLYSQFTCTVVFRVDFLKY